MAEQLLDGADVVAIFRKMSCEGMTQGGRALDHGFVEMMAPLLAGGLAETWPACPAPGRASGMMVAPWLESWSGASSLPTTRNQALDGRRAVGCAHLGPFSYCCVPVAQTFLLNEILVVLAHQVTRPGIGVAELGTTNFDQTFDQLSFYGAMGIFRHWCRLILFGIEEEGIAWSRVAAEFLPEGLELESKIFSKVRILFQRDRQASSPLFCKLPLSRFSLGGLLLRHGDGVASSSSRRRANRSAGQPCFQ